jgi:hypothetical protein
MRETRQSGSEGGARLNPLSLPLSKLGCVAEKSALVISNIFLTVYI